MTTFDEQFVPPEFGACARCARPGIVLRGSPIQCGECDREDEEAAQRRARVATTMSMIPEGYAWASFDVELPAGVELVARARSALAQGIRGAAFVGAPGEGKTSLAVAMMRVWSQTTGKVARFEHAHRLVQARAQHRFGRGEAELVERAIKASLLLIDDLADSALATGSAIYDVIQERHAAARPTWVTTAMGHNVERAQDRVAHVYGDGTARRVFEHARIFDFSTKRVATAPIRNAQPDTKKRAAGDDS